MAENPPPSAGDVSDELMRVVTLARQLAVEIAHLTQEEKQLVMQCLEVEIPIAEERRRQFQKFICDEVAAGRGVPDLAECETFWDSLT